MKKIFLSILTIAFTIAGAAGLKAQTVEEIIQKHYDAIGGVDNWKKINSIKMVASSNSGGVEVPITMTLLQAKGFKVEYTFNGMTGYTIMTDKAGWNYSPFGGQTKPEAIPEEAIKEAQDALDIQGPLFDYKTKGHKVTYLGKDDVEGTECYKLKVVFPSGKEETIFIDTKTFYHIKSTTKSKANGKETEVSSAFSNFQKLPEGITYPMTMENGGNPLTIKTIEINKGIDENYFKLPEVKEPETKK